MSGAKAMAVQQAGGVGWCGMHSCKRGAGIAGVMQCSDVYKPGSWLIQITGDIINMHADVLEGYENGDDPDVRLEAFQTFPGALVHPQSKKVR